MDIMEILLLIKGIHIFVNIFKVYVLQGFFNQIRMQELQHSDSEIFLICKRSQCCNEM